MKRFALAAMTAALMSSGAYAADVFGGGSTKDAPAFGETRVVNWTGFYIGGSVGYGNANHELSVHDYFKDFVTGDYVTVTGDSREVGNLDGLNSTGVVGDVRLGYDRAFGRFLVGIFGSYGFSGMEATGSGNLGILGDSFSLEKGDEWSVGARAGMIVAPRTLVYILAAYTQTDYELLFNRGAEAFSKETTFDGVTVGGGVEFALTGNIFLGLEGTHTFYGEETIWNEYDAASNVGTRVDDKLGETKVMGTLKIKLNGGLGGLGD